MKLQNKHVIFGLFIFMMVFAIAGYWRNKKLAETGVKTIAKVYEIKKVKHGKNGSDVLAYYTYLVEGKEYQYSSSIKPDVEVGKCYELIYSSEDPKMVDINFAKEVDCSKY